MIIELLILFLAIPVGFVVAYLARDELVAGRIWFRTLIIVSIAIGVLVYPFGLRYITWTCAFIAIVAFISIIKSKDRKWTKLKF